ncbi:MAG: LPS export ABC transporter periplasmic protein LptC [Bacteroidota bacterium]|nr:LPS export ABC transporter periplasmic protein LptC [Bacteroidota bacterium]
MFYSSSNIKKNILILFAGSLLVTACENDIKAVQALGQKKLGVEEGKNIVSILSSAGKQKAKLTAPYMLRYQMDTIKTEFPKSLHVDFYDSARNVESQLFAKYGEYKETQQVVFLKDSVIAFNIRKDTLWCDELYWNQSTGRYYTDKRVVISQHDPRQKLAGIGFESDQDLKNITIKKVGRVFTGQQSFFIAPDSTY